MENWIVHWAKSCTQHCKRGSWIGAPLDGGGGNYLLPRGYGWSGAGFKHKCLEPPETGPGHWVWSCFPRAQVSLHANYVAPFPGNPFRRRVWGRANMCGEIRWVILWPQELDRRRVAWHCQVILKFKKKRGEFELDWTHAIPIFYHKSLLLSNLWIL